jgi:hypothetical protein
LVCKQNIRKTSSIPEDVKANGSAEAAVGLIKKQARTILSESKLKREFWPFAVAYAAQQRERHALNESPLLKLGMNVVVEKRVSRNRRIKGFEPICQVAKYLGPIADTSEGHYVWTEDEKVMKTTRVVPCDDREMEEEDKDLQRIGWNRTADPDGKLFSFNKDTCETSWTTPLRVEEATEEHTKEEEPTTRMTKLVGKQPPPRHYLKTVLAQRKDDEGDEE